MQPSRRAQAACWALAVLSTSALGVSSGTLPVGAESIGSIGLGKVKHIVFMMQENRSADTYLGQLHAEGQPAYAAEPTTGNPNPLDPNGPRINYRENIR